MNLDETPAELAARTGLAKTMQTLGHALVAYQIDARAAQDLERVASRVAAEISRGVRRDRALEMLTSPRVIAALEGRRAVIENGASWVEPLLKNFKDLWKKMPQEFGGTNPIDQIRRNIYISPFWEEDPAYLAELLGEDHVLYGSDYPHPEGLADPVGWRHEIDDLPDADVERIMSTNLKGLLAA